MPGTRHISFDQGIDWYYFQAGPASAGAVYQQFGYWCDENIEDIEQKSSVSGTELAIPWYLLGDTKPEELNLFALIAGKQWDSPIIHWGPENCWNGESDVPVRCMAHLAGADPQLEKIYFPSIGR